MKLLKKLAILATALTLCLGASALVTACGGGDTSSSNVNSSTSSSAVSSTEVAANAYTFIVLNNDGTPAKDINVQLCNATGCLLVVTDENGKATFSTEGEYEIHILDASYASIEFEGPTMTPATFSTITLTLK